MTEQEDPITKSMNEFHEETAEALRKADILKKLDSYKVDDTEKEPALDQSALYVSALILAFIAGFLYVMQ